MRWLLLLLTKHFCVFPPPGVDWTAWPPCGWVAPLYRVQANELRVEVTGRAFKCQQILGFFLSHQPSTPALLQRWLLCQPGFWND